MFQQVPPMIRRGKDQIIIMQWQ